MEPAPTPVSPRIKCFDLMKGFVIIAIVMIHTFLLCGTESVEDVAGGGFPLYLQAIYTGLMIFFIASGYFFRPGRGYLTNVLKRVVPLGMALVVCVAALPLILYCWLSLLGQSPDISQYQYALGRLAGSEALFMPFDQWSYDPPVLDTTNGYYFLEIMLVAFVLFYAIAGWATENGIRFVSVSAALLTCSMVLIEVVDIRLPLYAETAPLATAFMLIGAYTGKRSFAEWLEGGWWMKRQGWILFGILFAVSAVTVALFPPGNNFDGSKFGAYGGWSVYPFFILGCSVSYFFLMVFAVLTRSRTVSRALGSVGKHTLGILLGHVAGMKIIISLFYRLDSIKFMSPGIPSWAVILFGIADVALCMTAIAYGLKLAGRTRRQLRVNSNVPRRACASVRVAVAPGGPPLGPRDVRCGRGRRVHGVRDAAGPRSRRSDQGIRLGSPVGRVAGHAGPPAPPRRGRRRPEAAARP